MIKSRNLLNFFKISLRNYSKFDTNVNYYAYLGLKEDASESDIKQAFRRKSIEHHPDKNNGKESEHYKRVTEAYTILSNKETKQEYDDARNNSWSSTEKIRPRRGGFGENYRARNKNYYSTFREKKEETEWQQEWQPHNSADYPSQSKGIFIAGAFLMFLLISRSYKRQEVYQAKLQPEERMSEPRVVKVASRQGDSGETFYKE